MPTKTRRSVVRAVGNGVQATEVVSVNLHSLTCRAAGVELAHRHAVPRVITWVARRMCPMSAIPVRPEAFSSLTAAAELEDVRARLRATRWLDTPEDAGSSLELTWLTCARSSPTGRTGSTGPPRERRLPGCLVSAPPSAASGSTSFMSVAPRWADRSCRWLSATAGRTRSGATRRSSRR